MFSTLNESKVDALVKMISSFFSYIKEGFVSTLARTAWEIQKMLRKLDDNKSMMLAAFFCCWIYLGLHLDETHWTEPGQSIHHSSIIL